MDGSARQPIDRIEKPLARIALITSWCRPFAFYNPHPEPHVDRAIRVFEAPTPAPGQCAPEIGINISSAADELECPIDSIRSHGVKIHDRLQPICFRKNFLQ